ncbi:MAG: PilZ domain-containing protein [Sphingomicrobium sp.]
MNFRMSQKPRELRRRVNIRARLRAKGGWTDARILNVSSRGLLISAAARSPVQGTTIELWHGDHVIVGTVVWQEGARVGVHSSARVPVDDIMELGDTSSLRAPGGEWPKVERRKRPRSHDESRLRGRAIEFAGVAFVAMLLAAGATVLVQDAFARPLNRIDAALTG